MPLVPQFVPRVIFVFVAVFALAFTAHGDFQKLAALPLNSQPGSVFQGPDGCLYGVLRPNSQSSGAVYRISPSGTLTYLHRFEYVEASNVANSGGSGGAQF